MVSKVVSVLIQGAQILLERYQAVDKSPEILQHFLTPHAFHIGYFAQEHKSPSAPVAISVVTNIPESLAIVPVGTPAHHKAVLPNHGRHYKDAYFAHISATTPDLASESMAGLYCLKVVPMYQQKPVVILVLMAEA